MKSLYLTFVLFACLPICFSQNLIGNGGFENYSSLPTNVMQSDLCIGWSKCNQGGGGTSDYFRTNASGLVQLPNSYYATLNPHSGEAVMGFISYHGTSTNYREYLSHALSAPLSVGQLYQVSFFLTNGVYNGNYGGCGSNQLSISFTTSQVSQIGTGPIQGITPQFTLPTIFYNEDWQNFTFNFIADSAYQYILIGNFSDNAATLIQNFENSPIDIAYYFIDDVAVYANLENGISETTLAKEKIFYNPFNHSIRFKETGTSGPIRFYSSDGKLIANFEITDQKFESTIDWQPGVYFYKAENDKIKSIYGKIIIF